MANSAKKKCAKELEAKQKLYGQIVYGILAFYVLFRFCVHWGSVGWTTLLWLIISTMITFGCMGQVLHGVSAGVQSEFFFDVFAVSCFAQVCMTFSDWGWLVYLLIPGYFLFKYLSSCCSGSSGPEIPPEVQEAWIKQQEEEQKKNKRKKSQLKYKHG